MPAPTSAVLVVWDPDSTRSIMQNSNCGVREITVRKNAYSVALAYGYAHGCARTHGYAQTAVVLVLEDRLSKRARDELHGERGGAVALIQDRVYFGDLEGPQLPGPGEDLHGELRLAVREPTADGRANTGSFVGVDRVHVEGEVDA